MPCLNEATCLQASCSSLGFGVGREVRRRGQSLIIVDNGSTDDSIRLAQAIREKSPRGRVRVVLEEVRSQTAARARGTEVALSDIGANFIIQVDADTDYGPDYIDSLWSAGKELGQGHLFESRMEWPEHFLTSHSKLLQRLEEVDALLECDSSFDVVVDDKGCAFWSDDYLLWGGHRQEYWCSGEEMLAETTRMFMRGHKHGARRSLVDRAFARHSTRNWKRNSAFEFASAGFPMPPSWRKLLGQRTIEYETLDDNTQPSLDAIEMRRRILSALFLHLPHLMRPESNRKFRSDEQPIDSPTASASESSHFQPARLIEEAMQMAQVFAEQLPIT